MALYFSPYKGSTRLFLNINNEANMKFLLSVLALESIHAGITVELELCTDKDSTSGVRVFAEAAERKGFNVPVRVFVEKLDVCIVEMTLNQENFS